MDPRDRIAIVTGAGSGIGRATALALAGAGAVVVAADLNRGAAEETVDQVTREGGRARAATVDVTRRGELETLFGDVERSLGGLDILHNNAGIGSGPGVYPEADPEEWERVVDVNLRAVILGTQLGIRAMRRRGGGVIVNTASLAGLSGYPPDPVYGATKGGVVLFTLSLAPLAEREGIRVNCVCPGITDTPMIRQPGLDPRPGYPGFVPADIPLIPPEAVADGVLTLIRDDSLAGRALKVMLKGASIEPLPRGAWRPS